MAGTGGTSAGGRGGGAGTSAAGAGGRGGSGQVIVSIDFIGGSTPAGGAGGAVVIAAPAMAATETAGVKSAANWNGAANARGR